MSDAVERLRKRTIEQALQGPGKASGDARRAAYDNADAPAAARALIAKVANTAWKVTDEDVAAARQAGLSEDEIFELVVCAALGHAPDVVKTLMYRPELFGGNMSPVFQEVMRGPSSGRSRSAS